MHRRSFLSLFGTSAAAWPVAARAQQPAMPVVGYLTGRTPEAERQQLAAFVVGLKEAGYTEKQNVLIESRFAEGNADKLPLLGADLLLRQVSLIVYAGIPSGDQLLPLMRNSRIPILFVTGSDPVSSGLVASFSRPGGNLTGINTLVSEIASKHVDLLHQLLPSAKKIAFLSNGSTRSLRDAVSAANALGLEVLVFEAPNAREIDTAFTRLQHEGVEALLVLIAPLFISQAGQILTLAAQHRIPAVYARRQFVEAGGLMSYDYDFADGYRRLGNYAGRILRGEKPADLPVFQPTKFELVLNLQTARLLGIEIPATLLAIADTVIE